ncbi:glutathione S-transferase theta-3-like [Clarias magur]|uniref:glutathione transferase n=1 Tax=Clarias magur TaxID=1594786 RepID=A0A8J4TEQ2_CLAMG|nr:glutathione S-transferase theta-3-like [Clarias magur]
MVLEIYLDLLSQPCRSVYIFAKKNNIPFEYKKLSLFAGEHYNEEFGKINIMRKVPAIRDGNFCLSESVAIMQYLAEKYGTPDNWYPADVQKRARVNEYLSWQHAAMRTHGSKVFWLRLMIPKVLGVEVPKEKMDAALEDLNNSLKLIEEKFLQDRPFIAGDQISLADLVAIVEIMQPCRSVYIFAKKNNIPFEYKKLSLLAAEHYSEEFGKINIMRKVPAIRDGDFCLGESVAIMQYLAEKYGTPDNWYPADVQKRARVNEYLSWQHAAMRMHGSKVFWLRLMIPKVMGVEVPKEKMDAALEDLNNSLKLIEEKFLQDRPFIAGDQISLADLVAIVEIMQPVGAGLDVFEGRPKLSAWKDRVRAEIGADLFDEVHQGVLSAQETAQTLDGSKLQHFKPTILKLFL